MITGSNGRHQLYLIRNIGRQLRLSADYHLKTNMKISCNIARQFIEVIMLHPVEA